MSSYKTHAGPISHGEARAGDSDCTVWKWALRAGDTDQTGDQDEVPMLEERGQRDTLTIGYPMLPKHSVSKKAITWCSPSVLDENHELK